MEHYNTFEEGLNALDRRIDLAVEILKMLEHRKCLYSDWSLISEILNGVIDEQHKNNAGYFECDNFIKYEGLDKK